MILGMYGCTSVRVRASKYMGVHAFRLHTSTCVLFCCTILLRTKPVDTQLCTYMHVYQITDQRHAILDNILISWQWTPRRQRIWLSAKWARHASKRERRIVSCFIRDSRLGIFLLRSGIMRKIMQIYSRWRQATQLWCFYSRIVFSDKGSNGIIPQTECAGLGLASVE